MLPRADGDPVRRDQSLPTSPEALNSEWVILENDGKAPFNTRGCGMTVGRTGSAKKSLLGIIDPGFVLQPGERMRMCTGNPGDAGARRRRPRTT